MMLFLVFILMGQPAIAKLAVTPPQQMIDNANLIVTGTIENRIYDETQRQVTIAIESILKGRLNEKTITLSQKASKQVGGWLGFDFPDNGNKVMVLLNQQEQQITLEADLNNVAIVDDNGDIHLYHGSTIGAAQPVDYEMVYQAFYRQHYLVVLPSITPEELTTDIHQAHTIPKIDQGKCILIVITVLLIGLLILLNIRRKV
jgi:hypothetical protein